MGEVSEAVSRRERQRDPVAKVCGRELRAGPLAGWLAGLSRVHGEKFHKKKLGAFRTGLRKRSNNTPMNESSSLCHAVAWGRGGVDNLVRVVPPGLDLDDSYYSYGSILPYCMHHHQL